MTAPRVEPRPCEWRISDSPVPYPDALGFMEERAALVRAGTAPECVWLLEHPPLYTGRPRRPQSADPGPFPFSTSAGAVLPPITAPASGSPIRARSRAPRTRYPRFRRGRNLTIAALAASASGRARGLIGVWVDLGAHGGKRGQKRKSYYRRPGSRWVSYHGLAINVEPDLSHFAGIVPCGIADKPVTSLFALGITATTTDVDNALMETFNDYLGAEPF